MPTFRVDLSTIEKQYDSFTTIREVARGFAGAIFFGSIITIMLFVFLEPRTELFFRDVRLNYYMYLPILIVFASNLVLAAPVILLNRISLIFYILLCSTVIAFFLLLTFLLVIKVPLTHGANLGTLLYCLPILCGLSILGTFYSSLFDLAKNVLCKFPNKQVRSLLYSNIQFRSFKSWLIHLFHFPPIWTSSPNLKLQIILIIFISLFLESLGDYIIFYYGSYIKSVILIDLKHTSPLSMNFESGWFEPALKSIITLFGILAIYPIFSLAGFLRRKARRVAIRTLDEIRETDSRPPLLFLRSFRDDQVSLPQGRKHHFLIQSLLSGSQFQDIDNLVTESFWQIGPVIAIGKPDDKLPPLGAARKYLTDNSWRATVSDLMGAACIIVLILDSTEGVLWELNEIAMNTRISDKIILLVPPLYYGDNHFLEQIANNAPSLRKFLPTTHTDSSIAMFSSKHTGNIVLTTNRLTYRSYELALRIGIFSITQELNFFDNTLKLVDIEKNLVK